MSSICSRPRPQRCRPKKRKPCCRPAARRRRPKTSSLCSRPRPRRRRSRRCGSGGRCFKPGPIVRNPYLNFLREFRKKNCGLSPIESIQKGAREWKRLTQCERMKYIKEAFYAPKRRRQDACAPKRRVC